MAREYVTQEKVGQFYGKATRELKQKYVSVEEIPNRLTTGEGLTDLTEDYLEADLMTQSLISARENALGYLNKERQLRKLLDQASEEKIGDLDDELESLAKELSTEVERYESELVQLGI